VLTYLSPIAESQTDDDLADVQQRREALRIRPLIESPRLRVAMGMPELHTLVVATMAVTTKANAPKGRRRAKRMPKNASAPATNTRTKSATKQAAERRFDRRALLESDR
jgi:hypothetical protein